jgi:putative salt-induced outer membrane protein
MLKSCIALAALLLAPSAFSADGFTNESELGYVLTKGNTDIQTLNVKQSNAYTFGMNSFTFKGGYLTSKQSGTLAAQTWNLGLRYERALTDFLSMYAGQSVIADPFQSIRQRHNTDLGGKYLIVKEETLQWFGEAGYRFTRENTTSVGSRNFHYLRAYTEAEKKWSPTVSTKYWIEYLPNLTTSTDWQLNTELSLNAMLTSIFSVKTGYLVRYDNLPATTGLKKTDSVLTTALVAKF